MRFAYIDSNGNEIPIPSVDALALRIELGAITENTQLYDAQADEWGPAHTHEIFHTLSRDAGEGGFVAPPPVAPDVVEAEEPEAPGPEAEEPEAAAPEAEKPEPAAPEAEKAEPAVPEPAGPEEGFGLTLAEPPPSGDDEGADAGSGPAEEPGGKAEKAEPTPSTSAPRGPDADLPYLDLGEDEEDEEPMDLSPPADATESEEAVEEAAFDFGGMEGGLEVEEPFEAPEEAPMDLSPDSEPEPGEDSDGGMELETAMEFDSGGFEGGEDETLDLETPMSQLSPGEPPSWMEEGAQASDESILDFSAAGTAAEETTTEVPLRERRTPRNRPSPPNFKKQRNLAVPIIGIVVLLAVGIGGYVAWPIVSDRLASSEEAEEEAVHLPPLSEELTPVMREASSAALAALFENARTEWAESDPLPVPPSDWLAGVYLANAGEYPQVETFWQGVGDFVDLVRGIELSAFDAALVADLGQRDLSDADAAAIRERADSGFVAATPDRVEVFAEFDAIIEGALALHQFLVANQDNIEYAPASVVTTDPVLEVEHATPEVESAMNDRLDGYFRAQQALEVRDRPRAEVLQSLLQSRIQEHGIR